MLGALLGEDILPEICVGFGLRHSHGKPSAPTRLEHPSSDSIATQRRWDGCE